MYSQRLEVEEVATLPVRPFSADRASAPLKIRIDTAPANTFRKGRSEDHCSELLLARALGLLQTLTAGTE